MTKQELQAFINNSLFACLGFNDEFGNPNIRKVFCTWHKGLGTHLISTNTSSMHVQELLKNNKACLYFDNDKEFIGACFTGKIIVHFDREYRGLLWTEGDEMYYPNGIDDEDYCVLEFVADNCRYYRFDDRGVISSNELQEYDRNKELENFYDILSK